ncbi:hypothetical protein VIN01S_14770 [Vibrio inusitatus NBRC 102082]|uniref:Protein RecA n=1 Tax=Vibrio inusitatus NBRC 102082 TaxID=1219070 RepID=A0A4Y3HU38_9VIBR|nr:hypothetical protein VIN01S_14770 [Vibrio inusitatus NBRC 102082]
MEQVIENQECSIRNRKLSFILMYGPESSGKTIITLKLIATVQREGETCVFIDSEHTLDPIYAQKLGRKHRRSLSFSARSSLI